MAAVQPSQMRHRATGMRMSSPAQQKKRLKPENKPQAESDAIRAAIRAVCTAASHRLFFVRASVWADSCWAGRSSRPG